MNKQFYRTKYNAKLGTYVAVSELAKSHQGDTSQRVASADTVADVNTTLQQQSSADDGNRTLKQLALALSTLMAITPIYANVTVNPNANAAHKATVTKAGDAANVWISTPSASGVSRNSYTQFDVNQQGVILNNARATTTSKITNSAIAQNPNLAKGAATTIVNEVVSNQASKLTGNLEVLGQRANVIIANPSGITVNGGGFINAGQVTLSTGVIGYNSDGSIKQHTVKQGVITIDPDANNRGLGGNSNNPTALELLGRSIDINAPVNATDSLSIISGTNVIDAVTGEMINTAGTGTKPAFAIDVAQVGGIYANSIYLHANEAGIGVNNAGIIKAKNNLVLNANGKITNTATGTLQSIDAATGVMSIQTNRTDGHGDILNQGKIQSANSLFIDAGRNISLEKDSYTGVTNTTSKGIVSISAAGNITGTGAVVKQLANDQDIYLQADGTITLTGQQGNGSNHNLGSNGGVYLLANKNIQITDGIITSRRDLSLSSTELMTVNNTNLYSRDTGVYVSSVGTDVAKATINLTNSILDAKTKVAIQSAGDLNVTNLSLPNASGVTNTRVQDVTLTSQRNLIFNQSQRMLQPITGKLGIGAVGNVTLGTTLTGANVEVKGLLGVDIQAENVTTNNIKLSTAQNLNITGNKSITLNDNTSLWASSGNINLSALDGNIVANSLTALANKGKISILAGNDLRLNATLQKTALAGTTLQDQTYKKSSLTAAQDINLGSIKTGSTYLNAADITSTAGNINITANNNIHLYRNTDIKQVKNADNTYTAKNTDLRTVLKANNIVLNTTTGNIDLMWLNADAKKDITINAKGMNRIYGAELTSAVNTVLHGGNHLRLWGVNSNSGMNTALSTDKNIYINSDVDANGKTSWAAGSTNNITAAGVLSVVSKGLQAHQRSNLTGGALLIDSGDSIEWNATNNWKATGNTVLNGITYDYKTGIDSKGKDILTKELMNGVLSIQSAKQDLVIDPKKITLGATGNIDIRAAGGNLTFVGYGGDKGNGSEQKVSLTTDGRINLQGQNVTLQAVQLEAKKDINIVSTAGDVVVDGVKNNLNGKSSLFQINELNADKKLTEDKIKAMNVATTDYAKEKNRLYKILNDKSREYDEAYRDSPNGECTPMDPWCYYPFLEYQDALNKYYTFIQPETNLKSYIKDIESNVNLFSQNLIGIEHVGSQITSKEGNIDLASGKGLLVRGSNIIATKGKVDIQAKGALAKTRTSKDQADQFDTSILIDGIENSYAVGQETDPNYNLRNYFYGSTISGDKGVSISSVGTANTDHLVIQGGELAAKNGKVLLESNKDILLLAGQDESYDKSTNTTVKRSWYGKKKVTTSVSQQQSTVASPVIIGAKDISIIAKGDASLYSTEMDASGGKIDIKAKNINLLVIDEFNRKETETRSKSSFAGFKYNDTTTNASRKEIKQLPVKAKADYISTKSEFNTLIKGAEFNYLTGALIQAGGTITLEGATTLVEDTLKRESNSVVWQSMIDKGEITETAKLPNFNGPTLPKFEGSLSVQVPVAKRTTDQKELIVEIEKLAKEPGNAYLQALIDNKNQTVNWQEILVTNESWNYKQQGLTAAGAAILAIVIAAVTAGAGVAALGTTTVAAGGGTVTTFGGITLATSSSMVTVGGVVTAAGTITTTATGFMVNAALTSLATQASISAVNNGGNPTKILQDLGSKDSIKGLLTSVVTAGLMDKIGGAAWMDKLNNAGTQIGISEKIITGLVNSTGSALVSTSINGGSLSDNLQAALLSGLATAVQGQLASNAKGLEDVNYLLHKIAHAAAGCAAAAIVKQCEAGAIGAAVGEMVAISMTPEGKTAYDLSQKEVDLIKGISQLVAGTVSAYAGYDVNVAANSAKTAIENNWFGEKFEFKSLEKKTLEQMQQLRDQGKYSEAYKLIYNQIKDDKSVPNDIKYWFQQAIEINSNSNTVVNDFIRTMTRLGLEYDGKKVDQKQLQETSNLIAQNVLRDIDRLKGIPDLGQLLSNDIYAALEKNNQTMAGWAGSVYYWNLKIVGGKYDGKLVGEIVSTNRKEMIKNNTIYQQTVKELTNRWGIDAVKPAIPTFFRTSTLSRQFDLITTIGMQ